MTVLVRIYLDQGNFSRAETTLTQLEGIMLHALPPEHFWFAMVASERSRLAERQKHLTTALQFAHQAVTLDEATIKSGGEGTSFLPAFLYQRATVELQTGQPVFEVHAQVPCSTGQCIWKMRLFPATLQ